MDFLAPGLLLAAALGVATWAALRWAEKKGWL